MFHGRHVPRFLAALTLLTLSACTSSNDWGGWKNPFQRDTHFAASPVPADFAIVVNETHNTFNTRQVQQQVITAADGISRNTYTTFGDYNNSVAETFSKESALTQPQLQAMWNEVEKNKLLDKSALWVNGASTADLYKKDSYSVEIRANGAKRTYQSTNGFPGTLRPLMLLVTAVRLPISQEPGTSVIGASTLPSASSP